MRRDCVQLELSLPDADPLAEIAHNVEEVVAAIPQHFSRWLQGEPHTLLQIRSHLFRKVEAAAHHANHGVSGAANFDCLSDNVRIGMKTLPP